MPLSLKTGGRKRQEPQCPPSLFGMSRDVIEVTEQDWRDSWLAPVVFRASTSGPLLGGGHALETTVPGCQPRPSKWFDHQTKCRASSRSEDMRRMNQLEGDRHPPDRRMSIADTIDSARCAFESAARGGRPYLNLAPEMLMAQVVIHDERGSTCPGGGRRSDRCARAWLPLRRRRRAAAMPRRRLHVPGWIGLDGPSASA